MTSFQFEINKVANPIISTSPKNINILIKYVYDVITLLKSCTSTTIFLTLYWMGRILSQNTPPFPCGMLISTLRVEISIPQDKGMGMFDCHAVLRLRVNDPFLKKNASRNRPQPTKQGLLATAAVC